MPEKIDRSKYRVPYGSQWISFSNYDRVVTELCDAYDAIASDPRLSLVATAERPEGFDVVRICKREGIPCCRWYLSCDLVQGDGEFGYSESRWLTVAAMHAVFPYVAPPDPRIAQLAALRARVEELESELGKR